MVRKGRKRAVQQHPFPGLSNALRSRRSQTTPDETLERCTLSRPASQRHTPPMIPHLASHEPTKNRKKHCRSSQATKRRPRFFSPPSRSLLLVARSIKSQTKKKYYRKSHYCWCRRHSLKQISILRWPTVPQSASKQDTKYFPVHPKRTCVRWKCCRPPPWLKWWNC